MIQILRKKKLKFCTNIERNICINKSVEGKYYFFVTFFLFTGSYIFVNSYEGDQSNNGKIARIVSPVIASFYPDPACFSFYFHMFGAHVGELRVFVVPMQDENTPLGRQAMWRRRGTQPDKWIYFTETINLKEGDYRVSKRNYIRIIHGDRFTYWNEKKKKIYNSESRFLLEFCDFSYFKLSSFKNSSFIKDIIFIYRLWKF